MAQEGHVGFKLEVQTAPMGAIPKLDGHWQHEATMLTEAVDCRAYLIAALAPVTGAQRVGESGCHCLGGIQGRHNLHHGYKYGICSKR